MKNLLDVVEEWFLDQGGNGGPFVAITAGMATLDGDFNLAALVEKIKEFENGSRI